jgi:single-stranded DNA-binding protein
MGADVNDVRLEGRVTSVPRRRTLPSGDEVVDLTLAVKREVGGVDAVPVQVGPGPGPGQRRGSGQVGRRTLAAAERLTPGDRLRVAGCIRRRWWAAAGQRRSRIEVAATSVERLAPEAIASSAEAG